MEEEFSRVRKIYAGLYTLFPNDRATVSVPYPEKPFKHGIHAFIDWSNIQIGFLKSVELKQLSGRLSKDDQYKLDMEAFSLILTRGRRWTARTICASLPLSPTMRESLVDAEALNYRVWLLERVPVIKYNRAVIKEYGVDELLSGYIQETLNKHVPSTIVLATGDGQPSEIDPAVGFFQAIEQALQRGWKVELYSFGSSMSANWHTLYRRFPKRFCFIYLDEFMLGMSQRCTG
ncbi:hypothetical protein TRVA0_003S01178 [Trichomonascus vanleenenianus]|uniref:NYN domain-containing protein n=1 Tax=Trichomonascus vanleenenianus TaxID=2268995 RepID=UPI003ECA2A16